VEDAVQRDIVNGPRELDRLANESDRPFLRAAEVGLVGGLAKQGQVLPRIERLCSCGRQFDRPLVESVGMAVGGDTRGAASVAS